jgi:hypothetical protein
MTVSTNPISICFQEGQNPNGLGMMMGQYLEQNLAEFSKKVRQGRRIRGSFAVEMEGGVAATITFEGDRIMIQNDVPAKPDLHLKGSYMVMSKVIAGQTNPFVELLRKHIRMASFPRRPLQCYRVLRFLRIPSELLEKKPVFSKKTMYAAGWGAGLSALTGLVYIFMM